MSAIDKHYVFDYPMNVNYVFQRITSVARSIKGLKFRRIEQPYKVLLACGPSMKSWGETVTITCFYLDESHTRIQITSVPVVPTTLVDWGKGNRNITNVLNALKQVLPPLPQTPSEPPTLPPLPPLPSSMLPPLP